jgi:hypothetical protein
MSSSRIITGDTIASYLPASFSQEQNSRVITLTEQVRYHIAHQLPIAFGYDGIHRMTIPGSLYLQDGTRWQYAKITHPTHWYPHTMSVESSWARRAVGFDGFEVIRGRDEDTEQWKTYHIDKIEHLEFLTREQVTEIFGDFDQDRVAHFSREIPGFCRNWNYDFRRIMIEREGKNDCKFPVRF